MTKRLGASALFIFALVFLPWFVSFTLGFIFLVMYKNFWELILGALCLDILFGAPVPYLANFTFVLTTVATFLFIGRRMLGANLFNKNFSL